MSKNQNNITGILLIKKLLNEILRVLPLLAIIVPFLFFDDSWQLVVFVTAVLAFILLTIHIVRKSMYPYIDIEELVNKAKESPIGAAIVLFGFFIFMSIVMVTYAIILTR
jgi:hypothetical protein